MGHHQQPTVSSSCASTRTPEFPGSFSWWAFLRLGKLGQQCLLLALLIKIGREEGENKCNNVQYSLDWTLSFLFRFAFFSRSLKIVFLNLVSWRQKIISKGGAGRCGSSSNARRNLHPPKDHWRRTLLKEVHSQFFLMRFSCSRFPSLTSNLLSRCRWWTNGPILLPLRMSFGRIFTKSNQQRFNHFSALNYFLVKGILKVQPFGFHPVEKRKMAGKINWHGWCDARFSNQQ